MGSPRIVFADDTRTHLRREQREKVRADLFCKVILASMGISNVTNEKLEKDDDVVVY